MLEKIRLAVQWSGSWKRNFSNKKQVSTTSELLQT